MLFRSFEEEFPEFEPELPISAQLITIPVILSVVLILAVLGTYGYTAINNRKVESDLAQSYDRLGHWGERLGASISPAQTPSERAVVMTRVLPDGKGPIKKLTDQFILSRYSREQITDAGFDPQSEWAELRPMLNRKWVNKQVEDRKSVV